jgi:uncharacterized protein (TIGR03083 family)
VNTAEHTDTLKPILTAHLFPRLERKLVDLLHTLLPEDWERQTVAPQWKVKDVAAHLLDTQLRKLSLVRDRYLPPAPDSAPPGDLVALINHLNQQGVDLYRRLSPTVLISLMEVASRESSEFHQSLDPFDDAVFAVSWAGESHSPNWFDTAREFTERWHHQQQIRLTLNQDGIMIPEFYHPVLDCFLRALPYHYRNISRSPGSVARFTISGDCGGDWYLHRDGEAWRLVAHPLQTTKSHTTIPQEIAWRIFTKGMDREAAKAQVTVTGDQELGLHVLTMLSIVG